MNCQKTLKFLGALLLLSGAHQSIYGQDGPIDLTAMGSGRMFTYNVTVALQQKAAAGDQKAADILAQYPDGIIYDANGAAAQYNQAIQAERAALAVQSAPVHMLSDAEKQQYHEKIQRLEALVATLQERLRNAGGASEEQIPDQLKTYADEFKVLIADSPQLKIADLREFISKLGDFDAAYVAPVVIDINNSLLTTLGVEANGLNRQVKIDSLIDLIADITTHGETKTFIEKELAQLQKIELENAVLEGDQYYQNIPTDPADPIFKSKPSLAILLMDGNYIKNDFIFDREFKKLADYFRSCEIADLKTILWFLSKKMRIKVKLEDGAQRNVSEKFVYDLFTLIRTRKQNAVALPRFQQKNAETVIEDLFKQYKKIDYAQMSAQIGQAYAQQYANVHNDAYINAHAQESPILELLRQDAGTIKAKLDRAKYEMLIVHMDSCTNDELKAVICHFAQGGLMTDDISDHRAFAMNLVKYLKDRQNGNFDEREPIAPSILAVLKGKIDAWFAP